MPTTTKQVMLLLTPEETNMLHEVLDQISLKGSDNKMRVVLIMQKIEAAAAKLPGAASANGVEPEKKPAPRKRTRSKKR